MHGAIIKIVMLTI